MLSCRRGGAGSRSHSADNCRDRPRVGPQCASDARAHVVHRSRRGRQTHKRATVLPACGHGRAQLDDEEPIGGSDNNAAVDMRRHHDETIGRPPVSFGRAGQRVSAARPITLATKRGQELDALTVSDASRLTNCEGGTRSNALGPDRSHIRAVRPPRGHPTRTASTRTPRTGEPDYRCFNHAASGDRNVIADRVTPGPATAPTRASVGGQSPGHMA